MTNQGKLLTELNPRYVTVLKNLPRLVNMSQNYQIILKFYRFIAVLCAKISSVYPPKEKSLLFTLVFLITVVSYETFKPKIENDC